jgi:hypothetical protein
MVQGADLEQAAPWLDQMAPGFALANARAELIFMNAALAKWVPRTELPVPLVELAQRWGLRSPAGDPFIAEDVPPLRALRNAEPTSAEVVVRTGDHEEPRVLLWEAWPLFPKGFTPPEGGRPSYVPLEGGRASIPPDTVRPIGAGSVLLDFTTYDRHRARIAALLEQSRREMVTLSTPVLTLGEGTLLQPLIGSLAGTRGALALEELLQGIGRTRARFAIVDVTGVPDIDRGTATQLIARAAGVGKK